VVRQLLRRWPSFWPRTPKALIIATRKVADLTRDDALRLRLARVCLAAAARRYSELTDFLTGRRLQLPDETGPTAGGTSGKKQ
jgi:hypothetical protein